MFLTVASGAFEPDFPTARVPVCPLGAHILDLELSVRKCWERPSGVLGCRVGALPSE